MRSQHPWLNRIAVIIAVFVLLVGALGFIVYKERPSLRRIASALGTDFEFQRPRYVPATAASRGFNVRNFVNELIGPEPVYPPHLSETATDTMIERFVERGDVDVRVCEMIADLREVPPKGAADLHRWVDERLTNRLENPFLETILIPMGAVLSRPAMSVVATRVHDAALGAEITTDFPSVQTQAQAELFADAPFLEDISLRSYHLFTLFKGVNWHPELASDFSTIELCELIEGRLESSLEGVDPGVSIRTETQELLNWMSENRVTLQESGFNPSASGAMSVLVTPTSIALETPWMRSAFGSGLVLGLPPALPESVQRR